MCQRRQNSVIARERVGLVEVLGEVKPSMQRQADRHVGVAGEVEVDLQRVGERPSQATPVVSSSVGRLKAVGDHAHGVGEDQLLAEADAEAEQPVGELVERAAAAVQLRLDFDVRTIGPAISCGNSEW